MKSLALFSEEKAAQVAAFFLLRAQKRDMSVTKLRLIKWMYLAERRSYKLYGEPIVGDYMLSMKHGPVLSNTLYLVENPDRALKTDGSWANNIKTKPNDRHSYMSLQEDTAFTSEAKLRHLSDCDIEILDDIWSEYGRLSAKQLETLLHDDKKFPEWEWDRRKGNKPIELEILLPILGFSEDDASGIIEQLQQHEALEQAFQS
ncbi:Panacea domain-containing protein [Xanthomonas dyei]|uniref:Panacea domain-containing protein n=1 Tax=Xanthomonas dyei TaxID=743699 RepID=UPI001E588D14|nr:Panacea domain-containing protein [Xanthomonas dyei]MCC4634120.1 SocA family protein [Xanthomonas dyei pv. eucalypti]